MIDPSTWSYMVSAEFLRFAETPETCTGSCFSDFGPPKTAKVHSSEKPWKHEDNSEPCTGPKQKHFESPWGSFFGVFFGKRKNLGKTKTTLKHAQGRVKSTSNCLGKPFWTPKTTSSFVYVFTSMSDAPSDLQNVLSLEIQSSIPETV